MKHEQLTIIAADTDGLGALARSRSRADALEVARRRVLDPNSANTKRAYNTAIGQWCDYADAHNIAWAPIDAAELVGYLEQLSRRVAPNTVRLHLSALCALDVASRVTPASPTPQSLREHFVVSRWEKSWNRDNPRAPRKRAAALGQSDLERVIAAAAEPAKNAARAAHVIQYARDRCLLLFGVCGAFRGSDLCELQLSDVETTERGLRVRVRCSKTDQDGTGETVGLMAQGRARLCPVDAFGMWRATRGSAPGSLFCPITRSATVDLERALTERHVTRLVSDYAKRAGLELNISAHSLRATFATLASSRGKQLGRVMTHGRWRSADVAVGYMRQAQLFDDNASAGLFE